MFEKQTNKHFTIFLTSYKIHEEHNCIHIYIFLIHFLTKTKAKKNPSYKSVRKLRTNAFSDGIFKTIMQMWNVCFANAYISILYGVHRMPFRLQCTYLHTHKRQFFPKCLPPRNDLII